MKFSILAVDARQQVVALDLDAGSETLPPAQQRPPGRTQVCKKQ